LASASAGNPPPAPPPPPTPPPSAGFNPRPPQATRVRLFLPQPLRTGPLSNPYYNPKPLLNCVIAQTIAACAVDSSDVDVSFADIGGLDPVAAKLRQVENYNPKPRSIIKPLFQLVVLPFVQSQAGGSDGSSPVSKLLRPPTGRCHCPPS
jgi:hypothetical protein